MPLFFYVVGISYSIVALTWGVVWDRGLLLVISQSMLVGFGINAIIFHYMHRKRRKLYDDMINDLENRVNKTVGLLKLGTKGMAIQNEMIKKQRKEIDKLRSEVHG